MITGNRFSEGSRVRSPLGGLWRLAVAAVLVSLSAVHAGDIEVDRVTSGSAEFSFDADHTTITASDKAIIHYHRFDVPADSSVRFVQPGEAARVLNRISSADPSRIMGTLSANGMVYFVNPAGVTFGPDSVVDVGRLYAAAGDIADADFLEGIDRFTTEGVVENYGSITAADGIHLMGREVLNAGLLVTERGIVTLSSGSRVYLSERDSRVRVLVDDLDASTGRSESETPGESSQGGVGLDNQGTVCGDEVVFAAGDVYSLAIRNTGDVKARDGGDVTFSGDGAVVQAGSIDASAAGEGETGGQVKLLGETVIHSGDIDASGHGGGGRVLIGGAAEGAGEERNATGTFLTSSSSVNADAVVDGDGGEVIVWSDRATYSHGRISARGGAEGGDGGFVETSSAVFMDLSGSPDVSAAAGKGGQWLIDPSNVRIVDDPTDGVTITPSPGSYDIADQLDLTAEMLGLDLDDPADQQEWDNLQAFTPDTLMESTAEGATIDVADLRAALLGNAVVMIKTGDAGDEDGNISFEADLDYQGAGESELTLWAHNNIDIAGDIYDPLGMDSLTLRLITGQGGDPGGMITVASEIDTGGGDFIVHGSSAGSGFALAAGGSVVTDYGDIWISVADDIDLNLADGLPGSWNYGLKLRSFNGDVHLPAATPSWVDVAAGGNIRLYGGINSIVGDVEFHTPVVLHDDVSVEGVNITFHDTIDGAHTLQLETTNGDIVIDGVAGGIDPLHGLVAGSWEAVIVNEIHTRDGGIVFDAPDGLTLRGDLNTIGGADAGDVSLDGGTQIWIAGDVTITTNHPTGDSGNVDFDDMTGLDADSAELGRSLTIDAGDGLVSLRPDAFDLVGHNEPLEALTVTSAGLVRLPSTNLRDGGLSVTADDIELHGYVFTGAGDFGGDVLLSGDVALENEQVIIFTATFDPITGHHDQRGGTVTIDGSVSSDLDSVLSIQTGGGDIGIDATISGLRELECDARFDRPEEVVYGDVTLDGVCAVTEGPGDVYIQGHQVDIPGIILAGGDFEVDGHDVVVGGGVSAGDINIIARNTLAIEGDLTATEPADAPTSWFSFGLFPERIYAFGQAGLTIGDDVTITAPEATSVMIFGGMENFWLDEAGDADANLVVGESVEFLVDEMVLFAGMHVVAGEDGIEYEPGAGRIVGIENATFRGVEGGETSPSAVFLVQGPAPDADTVPVGGQFPGGMDGLTLGIGSLSAFEVDAAMSSKLSVAGLEAILASPEVTLSGSLDLGALEIATEVVNFDGADVTTTGSQSYCLWDRAGELEELMGEMDPRIVLHQSANLTAGGELVFAGKLDSGAGPAADLTISADDTVRLMGAVGGEAPLADLEIDAAGEDIHLQAGQVTTTGSQLYRGNLNLAADMTVEGSDVDFDGQIMSVEAVVYDDGSWEPIGEESIARALRVYDDGITEFRGLVNGLASIRTDAAGTTRLHADINVGSEPTPGTVVFNDPVVLAEDVVITDSGTAGIFFNNTVDSESEPVSLTLITDTACTGPDLPVVSFAADVGAWVPLSELLINHAGRPEVPIVATIVAARRDAQGDVVDDPTFEIAFNVDEFQAGQNEKFTVLGSATIDADAVVLGDLSATGSVEITAPTDITFLRREPGDVLMADGAVLGDDGLDIIVAQDLTLTGPVTIGGTGPEATVVSVDGTITGVDDQTPNMTVGELSVMPVLLAEGRVLDASIYRFTPAGIGEDLRAAQPLTLPHVLRLGDVLGTAFSEEQDTGGGEIEDDYTEGRLPDNQ